MTHTNFIFLAFLLLPPALLLSVVAVFRRYRRRPSVPLLGALNLLIVCLMFSLVLPLAETYYRFVYDQTDAYQASRISERWVKRHYRFNNVKMRDNIDYRNEIAPGKTRITIMGDSYTNGHGVPDVEDRFGNRLRRAFPDREVHILSTDGFDTGPILQRLRKFFNTGYETDLVLYAYCLNDNSDLMTEFNAAAMRLYTENPHYLFRHSYFLNTYYYRVRIANDPVLARYFEEMVATYQDRRWGVHRARLAELNELVAAQGARLLVTTFPFFEWVEDPVYVGIHRQLDEFWNGLEIPHLDLLELYREEPFESLIVNPHDTHPNAHAHALAAKELERFIRTHS